MCTRDMHGLLVLHSMYNILALLKWHLLKGSHLDGEFSVTHCATDQLSFVFHVSLYVCKLDSQGNAVMSR